MAYSFSDHYACCACIQSKSNFSFIFSLIFHGVVFFTLSTKFIKSLSGAHMKWAQKPCRLLEQLKSSCVWRPKVFLLKWIRINGLLDKSLLCHWVRYCVLIFFFLVFTFAPVGCCTVIFLSSRLYFFYKSFCFANL